MELLICRKLKRLGLNVGHGCDQNAVVGYITSKQFHARYLLYNGAIQITDCIVLYLCIFAWL